MFVDRTMTMQSSEVYSLLVRRIRRGMVIFSTLWLVAIVAGALAFWGPRIGPWGIAIFLTAMFCRFCFGQVRQSSLLAREISADPGIVAWAQLSKIRPVFMSDRFLNLDLHDGRKFEVGLPLDEMRTFILWMSERNPAIRWELGDRVDSTTDSH